MLLEQIYWTWMHVKTDLIFVVTDDVVSSPLYLNMYVDVYTQEPASFAYMYSPNKYPMVQIIHNSLYDKIMSIMFLKLVRDVRIWCFLQQKNRLVLVVVFLTYLMESFLISRELCSNIKELSTVCHHHGLHTVYKPYCDCLPKDSPSVSVELKVSWSFQHVR